MVRVVLVGANHAGTAAANTILDNYPGTELIIFDQNSNISYLGCGTALWIGKQIDSSNGLFYSSKEALESKKAIVHMEAVVHKVDFGAKRVYATLKDKKEVSVSYDKLILATGSIPVIPPIQGKDLKQVQTVKLFQDAEKLIKALDKGVAKRIGIVGGGYIGVELAEAVVRRGAEADLFDNSKTVLSHYYDDWFTHDMDKNLEDHKIHLHLGERVLSIKGTEKVEGIVTEKGEYPVDYVVFSTGFRANSVLGKDQLELLFPNGPYKVDKHQQTSHQDVYAVGDCANVYYNSIGKPAYIALATNAVRSGIIAAHNAMGTCLETVGVQGSNGISIYGLNMVSTGLSLKAAEQQNLDVSYTDFEDYQKPEFIKTNNNLVKIRIVYGRKTRKILGAQLASHNDISMVNYLFSLAIEEGVTIDKLKLLDIFFLPHFNKPYNYITMAALKAK